MGVLAAFLLEAHTDRLKGWGLDAEYAGRFGSALLLSLKTFHFIKGGMDAIDNLMIRKD